MNLLVKNSRREHSNMAKHPQTHASRLPVTFHQSFIPERAYISALLKYAARAKEGTDQEISAETGIPTGQSSGKVPAMIDYARGMGLIHVERDLFFDGAVQIGWFETDSERRDHAAANFVFHGPQYHGLAVDDSHFSIFSGLYPLVFSQWAIAADTE